MKIIIRSDRRKLIVMNTAGTQTQDKGIQDKSAFMVEEDQDEGDGKNGYVGERGSHKYAIRGQLWGQEVAGRKTSR